MTVMGVFLLLVDGEKVLRVEIPQLCRKCTLSWLDTKGRCFYGQDMGFYSMTNLWGPMQGLFPFLYRQAAD
jgi:hypothetical protein